MNDTIHRKQRQLILLAATISLVLREQSTKDDTSPARLAWTHAGHPHRRTWSWNPRKSQGWRLAGRLAAHGCSRPDGL